MTSALFDWSENAFGAALTYVCFGDSQHMKKGRLTRSRNPSDECSTNHIELPRLGSDQHTPQLRISVFLTEENLFALSIQLIFWISDLSSLSHGAAL